MTNRKKICTPILIVFLWSVTTLFAVPRLDVAHASRIEELRSKITEKNSQIKQLEAEMAESQRKINELETEKNNLQTAIKVLDTTRKKLGTDIAVTEKRIEVANLSIEKLAFEISDKGMRIKNQKEAIAGSIRRMNETDRQSFVELFLTNNDLSEFWGDVESLRQFQNSVREHVTELNNLKVDLETKMAEVERKRRELITLKAKLADQKKIVEYNKREKDVLLKTTKNKESEYRKILAEKTALRDAFEQEMLEYESALQFEIDPAKLPRTGSGVLSWPLDGVFITQHFGNTSFSKSAPVYNGRGHNGIDLRASVGTPVKAAAGGRVAGTGDTDNVCPGASYGKWIVVTHDNGLSTLYAHLSLIKVSEGQTLSRGDVVGYSGNTGYSTGPHLHFTVYATQGMRIVDLKSRVCSGTYRLPMADLKAYLNPLLYL